MEERDHRDVTQPLERDSSETIKKGREVGDLGHAGISPAVLLLLSQRCTKYKSWAVFLAYCSFNLLCLLKLSLGWVQGAKSNLQAFCRARMASKVLSDPHSPEDLVGPPLSLFSSQLWNSPVHLLSPAFPIHISLSGLSSLSFVNCLIWGISEAGGSSALGCVLMVSQKCKSCM